MLGVEADTSEETDECCIFCQIAAGEDEEAEIMKKSEELVCFRDIDPAAPHHFLVVPTEHIRDGLSLHRGHAGLVKRMAQMGVAVLRDQGVTDMTNVRLGFHKPPYISVNHLHLHVLAPASQISQYMLYKFIPGTESFITVERTLKVIKKKDPPANDTKFVCWSLSRLSLK